VRSAFDGAFVVCSYLTQGVRNYALRRGEPRDVSALKRH
jgi:hypothetical protein